jgi:TRAP-type transport system small permease protein
MAALERYFITFNRWLLILMLAAMALIIFANVGLRYLTSQSIEWAEEVARHLMIWVTFVGAGLVYRYGGHVAIDNLQDALPKKLAMFLRVIVSLLLLGFFCFMVYYGYLYMLRAQFQSTAATQISFAYIYAAMPVGGVLLIIHWLFIVRGYITDRKFASDEHFDANASASL